MINENHDLEKNAWSPYAPLRWRNLMFWEFAVDVAKQKLVTTNGMVHKFLMNYIMDALVQPMARSVEEQIKAGDEAAKEAFVQTVAKFMEQRHWVPMLAQYELNGRQIFDLHDGLTEMLLNTDVSECTLDEIKLPYDCFYLRFGKQDEIKVPFEDDFEYVDGAFIAASPWAAPNASPETKPETRIKIGLTTVKKDGRGVMMPGYFLDFYPSELSLPFGEAVDAALKRRVEAFKEDEPDDEWSKTLSLVRASEVTEGAALARLALPLIFNSLFYLESLNDLPEYTPSRDTSSELTARWEQSKPNRRHKLHSELTKNGYAIVRLVGKEVVDATAGLNPRGGGVRTHWRRGYFRNQPHGPQKSLRKRVWIRPTVIRADRADESGDTVGRIYIPDAGSALH